MKTQNDKVLYLLLYPSTGRAAYLSSLRCLSRAMRLKTTRNSREIYNEKDNDAKHRNMNNFILISLINFI
jgi:hypothetical protein